MLELVEINYRSVHPRYCHELNFSAFSFLSRETRNPRSSRCQPEIFDIGNFLVAFLTSPIKFSICIVDPPQPRHYKNVIQQIQIVRYGPTFNKESQDGSTMQVSGLYIRTWSILIFGCCLQLKPYHYIPSSTHEFLYYKSVLGFLLIVTLCSKPT